MSAKTESCEVFLSPPSRGAPDDLRQQLQTMLREDADIDIASQQMSDRGVVSAMADIRSLRNRRARVFVESRYLKESNPLPANAIWHPGGAYEQHRECFSALSRAGIDVRADVVTSALQHTNFIRLDRESSSKLLLSSANFAPGSIDRHLNWSVVLSSSRVLESIEQAFDAMWDGDFRDVGTAISIAETEGLSGRFALGANAEAVDELVTAIDLASERIRFAYFVMSQDTQVVAALLRAADRGVDVAGIVDADQGTQRWNAVPQLRDGGVDARYYPGALTGASGRMHHKTVVCDRKVLCLTSANASKAATRSLEFALLLHDETLSSFVDKEILRLGANASIRRILFP